MSGRFAKFLIRRRPWSPIIATWEATFPALASPAIAAAGPLHHRAGWRPRTIPFGVPDPARR